MAFTPLERMQIKNAVERVLHVPGNYRGGALEMAVVFDGSLPKDCARQIGKDLAALLKSHSRVFQNVRLNLVCRAQDGAFRQEIGSLPYLQLGSCFDNYNGYTCPEKEMKLELLADYLKKFHARSKIIILVGSGKYRIEDRTLLQESLRPFLYRKWILLQWEENAAGETGIVKETGMAGEAGIVKEAGMAGETGIVKETDMAGETGERTGRISVHLGAELPAIS